MGGIFLLQIFLVFFSILENFFFFFLDMVSEGYVSSTLVHRLGLSSDHPSGRQQAFGGKYSTIPLFGSFVSIF